MVTRAGGSRAPRRFGVRKPAQEPRPGAAVELLEGEAQHATKVLRMVPGDRGLGLDGAGGRYPLVVARAERGRIEFELAGQVEQRPAPGTPGSRLPRIELALAWPRRQRGEALVDRAVQLGAARLAPLEAERSQPGSEHLGRARLERVAREALKQCAGSWLPELAESASLEAELARADAPPTLLLDPRAHCSAAEALIELRAQERAQGHARGTGAERPRAVRFLIGPEGGFSDTESDRARAAGARPVWIASRILRIETAAEAACALAGALLGAPTVRAE